MTEITPPGQPDGEEPSRHELPRPLPSAPPLSGQESIAAAGGGINRRMLLIGVVVGVAAFLLAVLIPYASSANERPIGSAPEPWALGAFFFIVLIAVVVAIVAFVMIFIEKTRSLAVGLFIALGAGLFIDAGTCIALAAGGQN